MPKILDMIHSIFAPLQPCSHHDQISPSSFHCNPIHTLTKLLKTYETNFTHFPRANSSDDKYLDVNISIVDSEEIYEGL